MTSAFEYRKIRVDARVKGWEKLPMDITREGWSRLDDPEGLRFLAWRMNPGDVPPEDPVFILTFSRVKKA